MASAPGAVHTAPQTGTPVPTEATDPAARAATVEEATAAQGDADVGARASPFVDAAIAAATPNATPPARPPMPADAPAAPKATWLDWLADDGVDPATIASFGLLTRDELLDETNDPTWGPLGRGQVKPVTTRDLQYWEGRGVTPRPVRRWHGTAVRALYADWLAVPLRQVRYQQLQGLPLEEIAPRIRAFVRNRYSNDPLDEAIRANADTFGVAPQDLRPSRGLMTEARRLGAWHERIAGVPTDRVEVVVVDANGRRTAYPVQVGRPPERDADRREPLAD